MSENHLSGDDRAALFNRDIRYSLFRAYIVISGVLALAFTVIHLVNRRPAVNVATAAAASAFCVLWFILSANQRHYALARVSFLAVFSVLWLPLGYLTSPGSMSAMPYLVILVAFILAVVVRNPAEYAFPAIMILEMPFLFRAELWFPDLFLPYTDAAYRINDLTVNFTVAISAIVGTAVFMMAQYGKINLQLFELSVLDDLTGLYNRRYLVKFLEMEHNRSERNGLGFSLAFIDLDNFKKVNDSLGHLAGDRVLKEIAEILRRRVRNYDIVSRYGGDEFVIIFPETDQADAEQRMGEMDGEFRNYCEQYRDLGFSVSWGAAESEGRTVDEVLALADRMLYGKKKRPK